MEEGPPDNEDELEGEEFPKPRLKLRPFAFRPLDLQGGGGVGAQEGGGVGTDVVDVDRRRLGAEGDRCRLRLTWRESLKVRGVGRLRGGGGRIPA